MRMTKQNGGPFTQRQRTLIQNYASVLHYSEIVLLALLLIM